MTTHANYLRLHGMQALQAAEQFGAILLSEGRRLLTPASARNFLASGVTLKNLELTALVGREVFARVVATAQRASLNMKGIA